MTKLAELLKRKSEAEAERARIEANRPEALLAELDAEIAAAEAAEAAQLDAERIERLGAAERDRLAAERNVLHALVATAAALDGLDAAEMAMLREGAIWAASDNVPGFARLAVRHAFRWMQNWHPELVAKPPSVRPQAGL